MRKSMGEIDKIEEKLIQVLGYEKFAEALTRSMSYDEKEDYYNYLFRVYDLDDEEEEEAEKDYANL